jgi:hypothetical protein
MPQTPVASEAQVEHHITEYLALKGWQTIKTDASLVKRGSGRGGVIPVGTPDNISFRASEPKVTHPLCFSFLWECKRRGGKLRESQVLKLQYLAENRILAYVFDDVDQARAIIDRITNLVSL